MERAHHAEAALARLMRHVDPQVAASFTEAQRAAIVTMLGPRTKARHAVEVRRALSCGGRRFYLVFLMGAERRSLARRRSEGLLARPLNVLVYLGIAVPLIGVALGYLAATGI